MAVVEKSDPISLETLISLEIINLSGPKELLTYLTADKFHVVNANVTLETPASFTDKLNLELSSGPNLNTSKLPSIFIASRSFLEPNRGYGYPGKGKGLNSCIKITS